MTEHEKDILRHLKDKERKKKEEQQQQQVTRNHVQPVERKRHKAKGPNPLSCKKKVKDHNSNGNAIPKKQQERK
jgi:hypothetical protein